MRSLARVRAIGLASALAIPLALAACGDAPGPDERGAEDAGLANPEDPGNSAERPVQSRPEDQFLAGEAGPAPNGRFSSRYTSLDLDACDLVSRQTEGEGATWNCPGLGDMELVVMSGDGRFDLDAGADNGVWESIGAFNAEPDTVEWRMEDGAPAAIIYRLTDVALETPDRTVLMIETVGADGCLAGRVAGDTPDANARARAIADAAADGFVCGTDDPESVGNAG